MNTNHPEWAVVLGTSSGLGAAVALASAEAGLNVFGMHRGHYQEQADALADRIRRLGRSCHFVVADAAKPEGIDAGVAALKGLDARVRLYVHSIANASIGRFVDPNPEKQFHPRQFQKTFEAMAHSFVYWAQRLVNDDLLAPRARIFGLTNPIPQNLAHGFGLISASKAALEIYVRHLAMELGPMGHRVNLLNVGLVETPAVKMAFSKRAWAHAKAEIGKATPAGRIQDTEEVARFLALLLHPAADFLNGATIDFTGGQTQSLLDPIFNAELPDE